MGTMLLADALMDIGIIRFGRTVTIEIVRVVRQFLQFKVAIWQIILSLSAAGIVWRLPYLARRTKNSHPVFLNYTGDTFDQIPYRWGYDRLGAEYRIGRIASYCPSCNCEIVHMQCPRCKVAYFANEDRAQLTALIRHGIEIRFGTDGFTAVSE